jgi:hypothetical protein
LAKRATPLFPVLTPLLTVFTLLQQQEEPSEMLWSSWPVNKTTEKDISTSEDRSSPLLVSPSLQRDDDEAIPPQSPPSHPIQQTSEPSFPVSQGIHKTSDDDNARLVNVQDLLTPKRLSLSTAYQESLLISAGELTAGFSTLYIVSEVRITGVPQNGSVNYWRPQPSGSELFILYKPRQRHAGTDSFSYNVTLFSKTATSAAVESSSAENDSFILSGKVDILIGVSPMLTRSQLPFPVGYVLTETKLNQVALSSFIMNWLGQLLTHFHRRKS